ncbi:MAG TPA: acetoacetate--CoA ligase [Steroidobacteraceae bacterium]|nr:acetoacetate--CoA ligase [Steroidobacteraceae bacterium]
MTEIWRPAASRVADANLTHFMRCVGARRTLTLNTYDDVYRWSIGQPADFWEELARFTDVQADWGPGPALQDAGQMPGARFFPHARLNFAENLLRFRDDQPALVFRNERGARRELSYRQLHAEAARIADGLRAEGVVAGDRVAGFLPNIPEAAIAMLATTSLGAIWSSCSADFGVPGVLDRFGQVAPTVIFTADGYCYGGKQIDSLGPIAHVMAQLPAVRRLVIIPYLGSDPRPLELPGTQDRAVRFDEFGHDAASLTFARLPFNHPLYILYSSGTTGMPKCIVHGAGGTLLQHRKEHVLHTDLKRSDRLFYFTTCGWMMWNWLMSALATGSTLILYDGSPFFPNAEILWRMAEEERVTVFGTSPKYLSTLERSAYVPAREVDLTALRTVLSTGSPLLPEAFDHVYSAVKPDIHLASISGGTDIIGCFALGCPLLPVRRGEIQCRALGMRVEVHDEQGPVAPGERGELVCTAPFPSMPVGFWNDPQGTRYRETYFERFPGIWHHGDYASLTHHDGVIIHGRSDAVLNPGGVRIGTSEIYAAVGTLPQIVESLAIAQAWRADVRIVLFVRLRADTPLDEALRKKIRDTIRERTSPRHVPARILAVPDLPRTRSGKLTELAVRCVVHGEPVRNLDALANPEALEHFRNLPELAS